MQTLSQANVTVRHLKILGGWAMANLRVVGVLLSGPMGFVDAPKLQC